jgi:hypothetical protein
LPELTTSSSKLAGDKSRAPTARLINIDRAKNFILTDISVLLSLAVGALDLSPANFEDEVVNSGKNAFVKFLAPW